MTVSARTVVVTDPLSPTSYGVTLAPAVLAWPSKAMTEDLDYALDLTAALEADRDTVARATAWCVPLGIATDLVAHDLSVAGYVVSLWLRGGTPDNWAIAFNVVTGAGRALDYLVQIATIAGPSAPPPQALTWTAPT